MKEQNIKDIELGFRQLTFGFENEKLKEQDQIMYYIKNMIETNGHVVLDEFIQYVKEVSEVSEFAILQNIFWLAQELKIHFRINKQRYDPYNIKKILLENPDQPVEIVLNKSVDDFVFQRTKRFSREIFGKDIFDNYDDQYEFSRLLAEKIRHWESCLNRYKPYAKKPYFPGKKQTDRGLSLISTISAKLDSFSLINAFYSNRDPILKLVDDINTLSKFYTRHLDRWIILTESIEEFTKNLPELQNKPDIITAFDRLKQILWTSQPYDMVEEAWELYEKIKIHNDIIVENKTKKCRTNGLTILGDMIEKMKSHLENHKAGPDLRNKYLYSLRSIAKNIRKAKDIESINRLKSDAEDKFDLYWEEVENNP
ncbi:MAG: hypothetical protein R6U40_01525 [Desulfobacterales bacterium]